MYESTQNHPPNPAHPATMYERLSQAVTPVCALQPCVMGGLTH